ncbi:threonine synthase [Salinivibrio socompensis]|uniref:threonine synthase n=1 Tax=Salinivibrio socompensis TaxID=1510206 RepID=UPI0004B41DB2|nr:threonine synthase [Salinivibrio socompensis]
MKLYNIKDHSEVVSFSQAVQQGLGRGQGLFFPDTLPQFDDMDALLAMPLVERSTEILSALIGEELPKSQIGELVSEAFNFDAPLKQVGEHIHALELFHGPTLAFKDFGGRFMAQSIASVSDGKKITILTATSGDTGAAVAHAFYGIDNIDVVILYPKGKISPLQEKLFCTLGGNIHTVAINGDFDDCQSLVKQAFDDNDLRQTIGLNSANSINISRLMAQICYYFELSPKFLSTNVINWLWRCRVVISVTLPLGCWPKRWGYRSSAFIAGTNANDTVPRYLQSGQWAPHQTVATLSNAMDVSQPNNWPRIEELFRRQQWPLGELASGWADDEETAESLRALSQAGYLCEPHGAIAYRLLEQQLEDGEEGIFLCTAHPAKFKESVDAILDINIALPKPLAEHATRSVLSQTMDGDFIQLKESLLHINNR